MKNLAYIFGRRIPGSTESVMTQERLDEIKSEVKNLWKPSGDYDCLYCVYWSECGVDDWKDHAYNLRDGTTDCFAPRDGVVVPPWLDQRTECYRCMKHSYEDCSECKK